MNTWKKVGEELDAEIEEAINAEKKSKEKYKEVLRDQFACVALNAVMINFPFNGCKGIAEQAYEYADAMLKAREKKNA
jgi:hypothetical protein